MRGRYRTIRRIAGCALGVFAFPAAAAAADTGTVSGKVEAELVSAVRLNDGDTRLARATIKPSIRWRNSQNWQSDVSARLEISDDQSELGTTGTFSDLSQPLLRSGNVRLEIDKATQTYRGDGLSVTLGKQTVAWGILDGLQVTDRFDAVRRRDAVFTDPRPERIARWGARVKLTSDDTEVDLAAMLDASVNQLPSAGGTFSPLATRARGGIPAGAATPPLRVSSRNAALDDATVGARFSRGFSGTTLSLVAISGPDTDPVFRLTAADGLPEVQLDYPRRTLLGGTIERSAGSQVWRAEVAIIPDQVVNSLTQAPLSSAEQTRVLAGVGLDWSAPNDIFVNAQLGVDHVSEGNEQLVRPPSDVIATLRVQKSLLNERLWLRGELISILSDGDGTLRPWADWRVTDTATVSAGADLIWGTKEGLIGQFRDQSRGWVRLKLSL